MKKSLIAGAGVAAFGLAVLPVAGVFAATSSSFIDTLTVTVPDSCTLEDNTAANPGTYDDRAFSANISAGTYKELNGVVSGSQEGKTMKVACNTKTGTWTVTAQASAGALAGKIGNAVGHSINPGVATTGETSAWAIKSNASIGTDATNNPYSEYKAYAVDTDKDFSTFLKGSANAQTATTFNPSYRVYVSPDQETGTYEGTVTYTVAMDTVNP